jgi:hypothetical protein
MTPSIREIAAHFAQAYVLSNDYYAKVVGNGTSILDAHAKSANASESEGERSYGSGLRMPSTGQRAYNRAFTAPGQAANVNRSTRGPWAPDVSYFRQLYSGFP